MPPCEQVSAAEKRGYSLQQTSQIEYGTSNETFEIVRLPRDLILEKKPFSPIKASEMMPERRRGKTLGRRVETLLF